jgi:hypothetical protein
MPPLIGFPRPRGIAGKRYLRMIFVVDAKEDPARVGRGGRTRAADLYMNVIQFYIHS